MADSREADFIEKYSNWTLLSAGIIEKPYIYFILKDQVENNHEVYVLDIISVNKSVGLENFGDLNNDSVFNSLSYDALGIDFLKSDGLSYEPYRLAKYGKLIFSSQD